MKTSTLLWIAGAAALGFVIAKKRAEKQLTAAVAPQLAARVAPTIALEEPSPSVTIINEASEYAPTWGGPWGGPWGGSWRAGWGGGRRHHHHRGGGRRRR